jgi:outer membrane lipoprotein-sorting protein
MTVFRFRAALAATVLTAVLAAATLVAAAPARAELSKADKADIARAEAYLNSFTTMKARFTQIAPDGGLSEGSVYMRRPGRLRFEYDPPVPLLIVADRVWLILYDSQLDQVDRLPLWSTPISILVDDKVRLSEKVNVIGIERNPGALRITLEDKERPEEGQLTLVFTDDPIALRSWVVTDAQGLETTVALSAIETGVTLDPRLFVFLDKPEIPQK